MNERVYLELTLSKSVEETPDGYIIEAEASNENLDFQEQIVLQRALLNSKDYFMQNGVVSWNHEHKKRDANGNPKLDPECIIGEPLGVRKVGSKTYVRAKLYKNNRYVEDVVAKLRAKSSRVKTSVGGLRPVIQKAYDKTLGRVVEKVISVMWDDLAITTAPVNQTLSPVQFVKSLQLGYGTNSAGMTGGRSLVKQDLDGAKKRSKEGIKAIIAALAGGEVRTLEQARMLLAEYGINDTEADAILKEVVARRKKLKEGVFTMDGNTLSKSFDEAVVELEKALKNGDGAPMPPQPKATKPDPAMFEPEEDEDEDGEEGEEGQEGHEEPDADNAGGPSDNDEDNMPPAQPVKKSRTEFDEDTEFLDVSPVLDAMSKSLKLLGAEIKAVRAENAALRKSIAAQNELVKSIGGVQLQTAQLMKSLGNQPEMRKSVLNRQDRQFSGGSPAAGPALSREDALAKCGLAVRQGKMSAMDAARVEDRLNKGQELPPPVLEMLKSIN